MTTCRLPSSERRLDGAVSARATVVRAGRSRAAFTLTELLIVIGLIVLLIALAVPAFSFITGSKSLDAAQNTISAMLGRARSETRGTRQFGVLFFRDPGNDRTAMMLVEGDAGDTGADDYSFWTTYPTGGPSYSVGDKAYFLDDSAAEAKRVVKRYVCISPVPDSTAAYEPPAPDDPSHANTYWAQVPATFFEPFTADIEYLPPGVGLQLVNAAQTTPAALPDLYVRTGVIMFGPNGQLLSVPYYIDSTMGIGNVIGLNQSPLPVQRIPATTGTYLNTHVAFMLYDREAFSNVLNSSESDSLFDIGNQPPPASAGDEQNEEQWLSDNGLLLLVNRYNGTLIRGE